LTKGALLKILDRTKPNLGAFRAIIADAEVVLNDRPLENPSSSTEEEMKEEHRLVIRVKKPVYSYEQVARFRELDLRTSIASSKKNAKNFCFDMGPWWSKLESRITQQTTVVMKT
jgi:hypothetical protein